MVGNWHCMDDEQDFDLYGFYDGVETQSLHLRLKQCDKEQTTCEDVDLNTVLGDKYIALLSNERIFDRFASPSRQIVERSHVQWIPLQTDSPQEQHYDINLAQLEKASSLFSPNEDNTALFNMKWTKILGRTSKSGDWFSMRIHINANVRFIRQSVYTFFDILRDIGGCAYFFVAVATFAAVAFTYNKLENVLVAQLYKKPKQWTGTT